MVRQPLPHITTKQERAIYAGLIRASKLAREHARQLRFTKSRLFNEKFIRTVHKTIFEKVFPTIAGKYRIGSLEPFEDGHIPPPADQVWSLMVNLVLDANERARGLETVHNVVKQTTPVELTKLIDGIIELSAFVHWKMVWIHPFTDGNGRTARVLGNVVLERYGLRPISIFVKDKQAYIKALHEANKFNLQPLKILITRAEYEELDKHGLPFAAKP